MKKSDQDEVSYLQWIGFDLKIFYCIDLTARGQGTSSDKLWMPSPVLRSTGHHFVTWSWCSSFFYLIVLFLIFGKMWHLISLSADLNILKDIDYPHISAPDENAMFAGLQILKPVFR